MHVVVTGAGFAGLAATLTAREAGAEVTLVAGGAGASSLYPGAADDEPWDVLERSAATVRAPLVAAPLDHDAAAFARELGLWTAPSEGHPMPRIATTSGLVRAARAHDARILDLRRASRRTLLVPRADRAGWDADSMVRSLRAHAPNELALRFEAVGAPVLRFDEERDISDVDLAGRHDETARLAWLADRLRPEIDRRGASSVALLLGPWLGLTSCAAAELEARLGIPTGEALAATAGTAGQRFEIARDALLGRLGARVIPRFAERIDRGPGSRGALSVAVAGLEPIQCDAVVIASGGLIGGGLRFQPPEHAADAEGPERVHAALELRPSLDAARLSLGSDTGPASSVHGPVLDDRGWPIGALAGALERAGVVTDGSRAAADGVYVAGDLTFGQPRTVLAAVRSGAAAARAALRLATPVAATSSTTTQP